MKKQTKKPTRKRINSPFAKNLSDILSDREISQRGAAEIAGVRVSVINDWLAGAQPHDLSAVQKLCRGLRVDFEWMLTGERSQVGTKNITLSEIFEFSGFFEISARRLKRKDAK